MNSAFIEPSYTKVVVTDPQATVFPASSLNWTRTVVSSPAFTPSMVMGKVTLWVPGARGQELPFRAAQAFPVGRSKGNSRPPEVTMANTGRVVVAETTFRPMSRVRDCPTATSQGVLGHSRIAKLAGPGWPGHRVTSMAAAEATRAATRINLNMVLEGLVGCGRAKLN